MTITRFVISIGALSIGALAAGGDDGRPEDAGVKWGYSLISLLNEPLVQDELRLTNKQRADIVELTNAYLDAMQQLVLKTQHPDPATAETRAASAARFHRIQSGFRAQFGCEALQRLTSEQQSRFRQIVFQLRSFEILYYEDVVSELQLTTKQKSEIAAIRADVIREGQRLYREFVAKQRHVKTFRENVDKVLGRAKQRAIVLLDKKQKEHFDSMHGSRIEFTRRQLRLELRKRSAMVQN